MITFKGKVGQKCRCKLSVKNSEKNQISILITFFPFQTQVCTRICTRGLNKNSKMGRLTSVQVQITKPLQIGLMTGILFARVT